MWETCCSSGLSPKECQSPAPQGLESSPPPSCHPFPISGLLSGQLPTCPEDHKGTEIPETRNGDQLVKLFPEDVASQASQLGLWAVLRRRESLGSEVQTSGLGGSA